MLLRISRQNSQMKNSEIRIQSIKTGLRTHWNVLRLAWENSAQLRLLPYVYCQCRDRQRSFAKDLSQPADERNQGGFASTSGVA